jgi:prefoldin alpha subunit
MADHGHDHGHEHGHDHNHEREEEFNRLVYLQNVYNQQYEAIMNELATFSVAQAALQRNLDLLKRKDEMKSAKVLINAEGGTYIEASVKEISKVMTYVGAGYLVEKGADDAMAYIGRSIASGEEAMKRMMSDRQKLEDELVKLQYSIEAMQKGQ